VLYSRHLGLYEQYVTSLLQLYEQHCPGFRALLILLSIREQGLHPLLRWSEGLCKTVESLAIAPIVHPQRWDLDDPELALIWLEPRVHPLLAYVLAPQVPQICLETALSCLRYLQSGGHSVKTRKWSKPLLKSRYFMRLKTRPSLSRFRNRQHRRSNGHCLLDKGHLNSEWWVDRHQRPSDYLDYIRGPFRFFRYWPRYTFNYDLWFTYRYALQLLPFFLANSPPDSRLASIATNSIFSSFCTAYPQETRKAKKSIAQYLSQYRPIRTIPSGTRSAADGISGMDVD